MNQIKRELKMLLLLLAGMTALAIFAETVESKSGCTPANKQLQKFGDLCDKLRHRSNPKSTPVTMNEFEVERACETAGLLP